MATKHYLGDFDIVKNGKTVKSGTMQFARVNAPDDESEEEAFDAIRPQYETPGSGVKLKQSTFREAKAVAPVKTDAEGNITARPVVLETPTPATVVVPAGAPTAKK